MWDTIYPHSGHQRAQPAVASHSLVELSFSYLISRDSYNKPTQLVLEHELVRVSLRLGLVRKKGDEEVEFEASRGDGTLQAIWDEQARLIWDPVDVDTISLRTPGELNLQDFIRSGKQSTDVCDQILRVLALDPAGWRSWCWTTPDSKVILLRSWPTLCHRTPPPRYTHSTWSNNSLEDKGAAALSAQLAKLPMGLKHLNLCKTSMSPKGVNSLCQALCANPVVASTLTHLDLSGNSLRGDDLPNLHSFLSYSNCLETLDLSNSDCSLEQVCASLLRGSLKHLSVLNMSKTVFSHRKCKEVPSSFKQFFSCAQALRSVSLSGTRLPLEALKALLLGLGCNPNLSDVSLDLSCCELRSGGSQILEGCIAEIPNISSLDISDNSLDMDLTTLLVWLAKNRSIRHLSLGKNFNNIKSKNVAPVLDNLVHMIQEEESPLTSLSLADSKLKAELSIVLNALGSNTSLTKLDISGNSMGDMGAKMLAKALQINTKLRTVVWDRNNVSPQGLQDVAAALEKNYTIRFMPIPIMDAAQALKANPEKTEDALLKMEQYLLRNHETRKYLQEQAYRLQQGIVTTTTQQMMDMMCVKVQDHLNSLRFSETNSVQEDMKAAENLMKDARNSKTLLPNLYHLRSGGARGACVGAIQDKLESMAGEVARVMDEQLQTMLVSMVDAAEGLCPHVMKRSGLRQELLKAGAGRMTIPRSFVTTTLLEQSGVDIINKISEVKLSMASVLSDRLVDEILESLSRSQHTLADHLIRKGQPLLHQEPQMETEVLDEMVLEPENHDQEPKQSHDRDRKHELQDMDTCMMTPKSKRKSILVRMLRPVSVAFEMEFDLDKALEEVPIHVEDPPLPPPPSQPSDRMTTSYGDLPPPPASPDTKSVCLGELPPVDHKTLEHRTKQRPKPKKRTKPSRPHREAASSSAPQEAEQNSTMGKLDEGLDDFFSKKVIKLSFKLPSVRGPAPSTQEAADKKRESRKSGFFNLIKSRTSRSEKSHGAAAITPPHPASSNSTTPSSSVSPVTEEVPPTSPTLPTPPVKNAATVVEPHQDQRAQSSNHTDSEVEACPTAVEEEKEASVEKKESVEKSENVEKKESVEKKDHPHIPRHIGVPVMGMDLLAEMKARQERMAVKKSGSSSVLDKVDGDKAKSDIQPAVPADTDESRPEPTPRSKPPSVTPKPSPSQATKVPLGPSGPTNPTSPRPSSTVIHDDSAEAPAASSSSKAPLPAPRLKRAPSEQERESTSSNPAGPLSPLDVEFGDGGDAFDPPSAGAEPDVGGRQWSSLKSSASPPTVREEDRERAKSLPAYVRPPSLADTDLSPAEEEVQTPAADLKSDSKSGEESGDDTPSV
ncbi:F-actin-uncapping protein LRRC16A-like protein [Lates japonicus]|uniref:F-actin-uncapping protein LRRC16A-like protein n=1 Tax=Lates japonicus TaxID=270547 RepID=A0AAD3R948_LATJO|nr:F-actin-uncapping protein LRRC16A-like protein [Lates japonicus]